MKLNADRATLAIVLLCAGFIALSFFRNGSGSSCALIGFDPAPAPNLDLSAWELTDLQGHTHRAADYAEGPYVMTFWATWCASCRQTMPLIKSLHEELAAEGISVLSVNLDEGGPERVFAYVEQAALEFPVLRAQAADLGRWTSAIRAVPTTLVVAPDGAILERYNGTIDEDAIRRRVQTF